MATSITYGSTYVKIFEIDEPVDTGWPMPWFHLFGDDPRDIVVWPPYSQECPFLEVYPETTELYAPPGVVPVFVDDEDNVTYPVALGNAVTVNAFGPIENGYLHGKVMVVFARPYEV